MIGRNARLSIRVKMPEEEIPGNIIIVVSLVLIFEKGLVGEAICANMLMVFSSVGSTRLSIEPGFVKMERVATEGCVFSPTSKRN